MIVLCAEALTPGKESAAHSNGVGNTIDNILTEIGGDKIKEVQPEEVQILVDGHWQSNLTLNCGASKTLQAKILPEDTSVNFRRVVWSSDNTKVVSVSNGTVRARAVGEATLTLRLAEDESIFDTVHVKVNEVYAESLSLRLSGGENKNTVKADKTATVVATLTPSDTTVKAVKFESSDPKIATVDSKGTVKGIAPGNAVIRATYTSQTEKKDALVVLTEELEITVAENDEVTVPVEKVSVDISALALHYDGATRTYYLYVGAQKTFTALLSPADTTENRLVWSSSNEGVLKINASTGKCSALKKGKVTVTVSAAANSALKASFELEVRNETLGAALSVQGDKANLEKTGANEYSLTVKAGAKDIVLMAQGAPSQLYVRYTTEDKSIAEIFEDGTLSTYKSSQSAASGAVKLTVTVADNAQFSAEGGNLCETYTLILTVERVAFSETVDGWGQLVRKLFGHFGAFLVVGLLAATTAIFFDKKSWKHRFLTLFRLVLFGFALACLTELLQVDIFTVGRGASFSDVIIDCSGYMPAALILYGIFLVIALITAIVRFAKKKKERT